MFKKNIILADHSRIKIGGPARYFFEGRKVEDIISAVDEAKRLNQRIFVLGDGSNILFGNGEFGGVVIKPKISTLQAENNSVRVGAGVPMSVLVEFYARKGFSGFDWAGGLPGTVGGAIYGNAGCFNGETKDQILEVLSMDISGKKPRLIRRRNGKCGFDYRSSVFKQKKGKEIILEALVFSKMGDRKAIRESIDEKIRYREERQPLLHPNIGSIFKNVPLARVYADDTRNYAESVRNLAVRLGNGGKAPLKVDPFPVIPVAHLISETGLKGVSCGGAMISPKHPNFIVNVLRAKGSDVLALMSLVKHKVKSKFGIDLEEEVIIV